MSIQSEINRINNNIAEAYSSISSKGGTLPLEQNSDNLATAVDSISGGSPSYDLSQLFTSIDNINNQVRTLYTNYFNSIINNYSTLSDEPLEIHAPAAGYKHYAIINLQGYYRILFFKSGIPRLYYKAPESSSTKLYPMQLSLKGSSSYSKNGIIVKSAWTDTGDTNDTTYISSTYSTLNDCVNAFKLRTYTLSQNSYYYTNFQGVYYTNGIFFNDNTDSRTFRTDLIRLSSNEIIIEPNN